MKTVLLAFTALILTSMAMGQNSIELPAPVKTGGMPLMEALSKRATDRLMDPARSLEIMRLLERINQLGTTMVVVTHEKDLVNQFKKRVVTLEQGIITSDGDGVGYNAR